MLTRPGAQIGALALSDAGAVAYTVLPTRPDTDLDPCSIYVIGCEGGEPQLVWVSPSPIDAMALSSDASALVAVSVGEGRQSASNRRLWLIRSSGPTPLFPNTDLSCEYAVSGDLRPSLSSTRLAFIPGSDTLVFAATDGFDSALYGAPIGAQSAFRLTPPGRCVTDFAVSRSHLAFCAETPTQPLEVYVSDSAADTVRWRPPKQISRLNTNWVSALDLTRAEEHDVATLDGFSMHGLLYRSYADGSSPLLIRIHGGPHLCSGHGFQIEAQLEASLGYNVLLPNIRGSAGWGERFRGLTVGEWGRGDYDDLLRWITYARSLPGIEPGAVFLAGGSYGGYLVNWAISHTQEFRGAIVERAVCNLVSKFGTSDNGFTTNRYEMGGLDVFEGEAAELLRRSPLTHARAVRTPVLLLHGEADLRVPIEQSEQWFVALRRLGVEATFWRWPGEGHDMAVRGSPRTRLRRLEIIMEWLDAHR